MFLHGATDAAHYRVVGAFSDTEFLARGERTGVLVLARLERPLVPGQILVVFTGLVDNGREGQDVVFDVDRRNRWIGWVTVAQTRQARRRIRLRLLRHPLAASRRRDVLAYSTSIQESTRQVLHPQIGRARLRDLT